MKVVKLKFNDQEIEVPEADAQWFIDEKGAKEIKASTKAALKAEPKKETQKTTKKDN